jgi:hypothetical protein
MILLNSNVLGTMFPIQISSIIEKSNATWGCKDLKKAESQLTFALFAYLGGLHLDGKAPNSLTEGAVQLLHKYGLPKYVKATSSLYDCCVRGGSFHYPYVSSEMLEILPGDPNWATFCSAFGNWRQTAQMKAWALRFLKRFTVDGAESMYLECLRDFVHTDARNKILDRRYESILHRQVVDLAKLYLQYVLADFDGQNVVNAIEEMRFSPTPNAVNNCCDDPRHRVMRVLSYSGGYPMSDRFDRSFPESLLEKEVEEEFVLPSGKRTFKRVKKTYRNYPQYYRERLNVKVGAVPKDVKSYRIVSPDDPINLAYQQAFVDEVNRCLDKTGMKENLPLHDQEIMRGLVTQSTRGGTNFATLDMSRASDTVRLKTIREIMPERVVELIDWIRPRYYTVDPLSITYSTLFMVAPMGCAFTLQLESLAFWALDCAVCHLCTLLSDEENPTQDMGTPEKVVTSNGTDWIIYPHSCYAMGDDQQVLQKYAQSCIEVLSYFGFIVNESKSFLDADAVFRESCGAESLGEEPVDGFYIPRHSLDLVVKKETVSDINDIDITNFSHFWNERDRYGKAFACTTVTALIAMAKVFMVLGLPLIGQLIQRWIAAKVPNMTVSEIGSPADDLWGDQEIVHSFKSLPMAQFEDVTKTGNMVSPLNLPKKVVVRRMKRISSSSDQKYMRPLHWAITSKRVQLDSPARFKSGKCVVCRWCAAHPEQASSFEAKLEEYRYQKWLQNGPNYESELDKLLGVTSPTPRLDVISKPDIGTRF